MTKLILASGLWTLLGVVIMAVMWRRWRRVRPNLVGALILTFLIAFFFTPFIPHASVEWSTPWPPAFFWVGISMMNGDAMSFELFTILGVTMVLWIIGLASSRSSSAHPADAA